MTKSRLIIANAGGFWGDDPGAPRRQVEGGRIDYLVMDYLAEVTMAILQKQRKRNPEAGFPADVLLHLRDVLPACVAGGIRIITNAGGVNPRGCRAAIERLADELGISDRVRVALVVGDDLFPGLDGLLADGEPLINMDTGQPLSNVRPRVLAANAYLGAAPIVAALERGANVIITGRVADAAVTVAPMIYEFGWSPTDWDKVAAAVAAGHIIECGAQSTGGNFTDWHLVKSYKKMGFPIVEAEAGGEFVVTKHPDTGGLVTVHTVAEQILYEIGAPGYVTPDVVARFDSIRLIQEAPDRVRVAGVVGHPAPDKLKVSISYDAGYRAFGRLMVSGPDALAKASQVAEAFWEAAGGRAFYEDTIQQFVGWNSCHPPLSRLEPGEVLIQLGVRDQDERKINSRFAPHVVPRALATVPGITYLADQGRPRASEVVAFWPALVARESVKQTVIIGDEEIDVPHTPIKRDVHGWDFGVERIDRSWNDEKRIRVPLSKLCLARSGDKGDTANIGVIARSPEIYAWMLESLTVSFVKQHFAELCEGDVERHEFPNLLAVNFLLHRSLGGGGTLSLQMDAQGKTYSQFLLAAEVEVPEGLIDAEARVSHQHHRRRV